MSQRDMPELDSDFDIMSASEEVEDLQKSEIPLQYQHTYNTGNEFKSKSKNANDKNISKAMMQSRFEQVNNVNAQFKERAGFDLQHIASKTERKRAFNELMDLQILYEQGFEKCHNFTLYRPKGNIDYISRRYRQGIVNYHKSTSQESNFNRSPTFGNHHFLNSINGMGKSVARMERHKARLSLS